MLRRRGLKESAGGLIPCVELLKEQDACLSRVGAARPAGA